MDYSMVPRNMGVRSSRTERNGQPERQRRILRPDDRPGPPQLTILSHYVYSYGDAGFGTERNPQPDAHNKG